MTLEKDVAAAVATLRQVEGIGLSEALNRIARMGLSQADRDQVRPVRFVQRTARLGVRVDIVSVADALETLDGPAAR